MAKAPEDPFGDILPGTALNRDQTAKLTQEFSSAIQLISRRRKRLLLTHNSLQNTIGLFLQALGGTVAYEVPYHRGGWRPERVVFDVVAQVENEDLVVEVKETVNSRDLGQVEGYAQTLKLSGENVKLYLGTDILNFGSLVVGTLGEFLKDLMIQKSVGVILVDKHLLVGCENHPQLVLEEMPLIVPSEDPVG